MFVARFFLFFSQDALLPKQVIVVLVEQCHHRTILWVSMM